MAGLPSQEVSRKISGLETNWAGQVARIAASCQVQGPMLTDPPAGGELNAGAQTKVRRPPAYSCSARAL
jgi:hypothetical protein